MRRKEGREGGLLKRGRDGKEREKERGEEPVLPVKKIVLAPPNSNAICWLLVCVATDSEPPADSILEKITPRVISVGLLVLMAVLAALGVVLTSAFFVFNVRYRHCKYVSTSTPVTYYSLICLTNSIYLTNFEPAHTTKLLSLKQNCSKVQISSYVCCTNTHIKYHTYLVLHCEHNLITEVCRSII